MDQVRTVLDVGCGIGHWGQLLAAVLSKHARLTGVDREESSVLHASLRASRQQLSTRYRYQTGDALALAFPYDAFDMVTCQTFLFHLENPIDGLREMLRVESTRLGI